VYAELLEDSGSAVGVLDRELSLDDGQSSLFPIADATQLLEQAAADVKRWQGMGISLATVLDAGYPDNLRAVHDRPPLLFVAGHLDPHDERSVAIIGSRRASENGRARARRLAEELGRSGYTIVSGLAAGIDTAAHTGALDSGQRTVAVIGTGLAHSYPPENASLQREITGRGAVVSQFRPETAPDKENFPLRNATMSGLALGTVIVEASQRSGARIQARRALSHGRPVFIARELLEQAWAQELLARPGVIAYADAEEIATRLEGLGQRGTLTA
jgi:DNA processing protein